MSISSSKLAHWVHDAWTEWVQAWMSFDGVNEETWWERTCKLCGIKQTRDVDDTE